MAFGGTIKLTGESEYRSALKNIKSDMSLLNSEMNVLATSTDSSGKSSAADVAKKKELTAAIADQKKNITALNDALKDSIAKTGENSTSTKTLQTQVNNATSQLNRMESQLAATDDQGRKLGAGMDDTGKKAGIFGDVLKANLASEAIVAGVKATAGAMEALGKGLVSVVGSSIKAFANYEQQVGGVETLFKTSADAVEAYANNAYKTAGLSANQYMSTVTSFSAALLAGLKGDTAKAAEAANSAVTDMSDNANKFGSDMATIQSAYQGFAKQNYTMLDNLKLGFGGTAAEMARLVNESGVLGDGITVTAETVKNVPFDQITQAIHNVQTEMGVTGTTAKEAASTISGSFISVKASWENVLTSFGTGSNKQIEEAVNGLVDSAKNLIGNVSKIIPGIVAGLGQAANALIKEIPGILTNLLPTLTATIQTLVTTLVEVLPQLVPVVLQIVNSLVTLLVDNLPMIIDAGIQILVALIQGIAQSLPELIPKLVDAVILMATTLIDNIDLIIDAGIQLLIGLIDGIVKALPKLIDKLPEIIEKVVTTLLENLPKIIEAGIKIIIALAGALIQAVPQLVSKIPEIITAIVKGLGAGLSSMLDVGKNLVEGLWNGISNAAGWVMDKIKGFAGGIVDGIKGFFGIKSPSRLFRDEIGKNLALGVGEGFTDSMAAVTKDMQGALPTTFDTGIDVNAAVNSAAASRNGAAGAGGAFGGLDVATLGAAMKAALSGMGVVLDDQKVGQFVTQTIERQVFAS